MATWTFVKRGGAPAGTITIDVPDGQFTINDTTATTIVTSSPQIAGELNSSAYLTLQGVAGLTDHITSVQDVMLADGVLSVPGPNNTWISVAAAVQGPPGAAGPTGPAGPMGPPSSGFKGNYAAGTTYSAGDWVLGSDGINYSSLAGSNIGHDPTTDNAVHWQPWPANTPSPANTVDAAPQLQELAALLSLNTQDVNMLILGDSTSTYHAYWQTGGVVWPIWPLVVGNTLAQMFPAYTVMYHAWNNSSLIYDPIGTNQSAQLQAGTGSNTLHIWNCSMSGWNTRHAQGYGSWKTKVASTNANAAIISLGHNDIGSFVNTWYDELACLTERVAQTLPLAGICVTAQNPRTAPDTMMDIRRMETIRWARLRGYGLIDTWGAFVNQAGSLSNVFVDTSGLGLMYTDMEHPGQLGQAVWGAEVTRHMKFDHKRIQPGSQRESSLIVPSKSLLTNGDFSVWHAPVSSTADTTSGSTKISLPINDVGAYWTVGAYLLPNSNIPALTQIEAVAPRYLTFGDIATGTMTILNVPQAIASQLQIGQQIVNANIPTGNAVQSVSGTTVTMSGSTSTGNATGAAITFRGQLSVNRNAIGTATATVSQPGGFAYWNPQNLSYDATNIGVTKDTRTSPNLFYESGQPNTDGWTSTGYAARLQQFAPSTISQLTQQVPVRPALGQWVFFTARVMRAADTSTTCRVSITQTGGTNAGASTSNTLIGFTNTDFITIGVKRFIPTDAVGLAVGLFVASSTDSSVDMTVDRCCLAPGVVPRDVIRQLLP